RAAQPVTGITAASASMYPVTTHWIWDTWECKSRPRVASATLTIVVSRIDITVPIRTTALTRHTWASMRSLASVIELERWQAREPRLFGAETFGTKLYQCPAIFIS